MSEVSRKWRPTLATIIAAICICLISIPVLAFLGLRLSSNQFVRETEQTLINQAAIYAHSYARAFATQGGAPPGAPLSEAAKAFWDSPLHPTAPRLNLRRSPVLGPLPDEPPGGPVGEAVSGAVSGAVSSRSGDVPAPEPNVLDPRHTAIAPEILAHARDAARTTLSGALFLDHLGRNMAPGSALSFANQPEVAAALTGEVASVLRSRGDSYNRHPLTSLSRDTWYRVFVAYPVVVADHVVGVVYLSRTPSNLAKFLVNERRAMITMLVATLGTAGVIGFLFVRLLLRPIKGLSRQSHAIATGQMNEPEALRHYGIRELATLGEDVMRMAQRLTQRSREISVYTDHVTHELKSPTTAIIGAAELLTTPDVPEAARAKLQQNILEEGQRMNALLEQLRAMTRLRDAPHSGPGRLADMLPEVAGIAVVLDAEAGAMLPMSVEHGSIVLHHLIRNAAEHGAGQVTLSWQSGVLDVADDGPGIDPDQAEAILEPFYTTKRDTGGTGLGLAIVQTILDIYQARLSVVPSESGAHFRVTFPG